MEEYIKKLLEQVRFEKAHKAIGDEIRSHIEDQIEENISEGMEKEAAEKAAVEDMGDPVETGISLDKIHRPQIAWGVMVTAIVLGVIGLVINILLKKEIAGSYIQYSETGFNIVEYASLFVNVILGLAVMMILYLIDYTTIAKYSEIMALMLIGTGLAFYFVYERSRNLFTVVLSFRDPSTLYRYLSLFVGQPILTYFMIPVFAGILYKYKGQKYTALLKSLFWIIITFMLGTCIFLDSSSIIISICMLIELSVAIQKEWIKVPKIPSIVSVWTLLAVVPSAVTMFMYKNSLFNKARMDNLIWAFSRSYDYEDTVMVMKSFGTAYYKDMDFIDGVVGSEFTQPPIVDVGDITFDIAAVWGLVAAFAVIAAVAGLIVLGFVTVSKTKNQLGLIMGSGCMMWLAMNAICGISSDFITLPAIVDGFIPFVSNYSSTVVVVPYAFLGIILSIYKYKNAYPEHVDISIRSKDKDFAV